MPEPGDFGGIIGGGGATVAVGFVQANDFGGRETAGDGIWNDYEIHSAYEQDRRTYMLPLCHPKGYRGQTAAFVQLAAPTLTWCVDWTASKAGAMPEAPDPRLVVVAVLRGGGVPAGVVAGHNPEWVLLDAHVEPVSPPTFADGQTPLYRLSGTYWYGHRDPSDHVFEDLWWPYPANTGDFDDDLPRRYPEDKLKQGLI